MIFIFVDRRKSVENLAHGLHPSITINRFASYLIKKHQILSTSAMARKFNELIPKTIFRKPCEDGYDGYSRSNVQIVQMDQLLAFPLLPSFFLHNFRKKAKLSVEEPPLHEISVCGR